MNNVFLYRMPVGIAGAVSRPQDLTVEPVVLKSDNAFAAYGLAGKYDDDGFFVPLADGDTADKVKGIYVRPYPLVPLQSVPVQYRGLYQIVTYYGKLGAVEPVYKETISYVDGI